MSSSSSSSSSFLSSRKLSLLIQILIINYLVGKSNSLNILGLFPHAGYSHFIFFHPILRGLAEAGHEVTVISHFPDKNPPGNYKDLQLPKVQVLNDAFDLKTFDTVKFYFHFVEFFMLNDWGKQSCIRVLNSDALEQVLRKKDHYDIIMMEQFNTDCMMGIAHQFKIPVIAMSSCALMPWHYERMGAPFIPSHVPTLFLGQSHEMTFSGRLANWFTFHTLNLFYNYITAPQTDELLRKKFGDDLPSVRDLVKNTSLFFVNQHFSLSGPKPLPPSIIELGGVHVQEANPLSPTLQHFLDSAEHGVIFISWGSIVRASSMPPAKRDGVLRAIRRLKEKVIWKWENETLANKPDNLYISKWLPQRDILCHPNVKVFMTHGGLMGSSEAAYCGVPTIITPMYGDQFLNGASMTQRGIGKVLYYEDITEETIFNTIQEVLGKKYKDNAMAVSHSYRHRPKQIMETAIWWVEYVAQTGGAKLTQSHAVHLSKFVYHSLDIYAFVLAILAAFIFSFYTIFKLCFGGRQQRIVKKQKAN